MCVFYSALFSSTIKDMLEMLFVDDKENSSLVIPIYNINGRTLRKVKEWVEYHRDEPQPTLEEIRDMKAESINEWDKKYLTISLNDLYQLVST